MHEISGTSNPERALSLAVIGPDDGRREAIVRAILETRNHEVLSAPAAADLDAGSVSVSEFYSYPYELEALPRLIENRFDAVLIDLDTDSVYALEVIEQLALRSAANVIVFSERADRNAVIGCMRAGAREFLCLPLAAGEMAGALARIPARAPAGSGAADIEQPHELYIFQGTKGGCGVTTVAAGFAAALAHDSGQSTLLIDLGAPLGDAAIQLGIRCDYSTADAFEDFHRLDESFLRSLLAHHPSGLAVLAAPSDFPAAGASVEAINKLLEVARRAFENVVVDVGSRTDLMGSDIYADSACVYLVTEVGLSELRNAHRMMTQAFATRWQKPQIVLNRYSARAPGLGEESVIKALTRPAHWKIPDEDASGSRRQHSIAEMGLRDAAATRAIRQMARAAAGLAPLPEKRRVFRLFRFSRPGARKASGTLEPRAKPLLRLRA